jgi:putative oxidoreductase
MKYSGKSTQTEHLEGSMNTIARAQPGIEAHRALHYGLWTAQVLLAVVFAMTGFIKLTISSADLMQKMPAGLTLPVALIRFIGVAEVAGVIGLILPSATRILPVLTPVAAGALALVMALAAILHASRGEFASLLVVLVLGAVAVFISWGRTNRAPIPARSNGNM